MANLNYGRAFFESGTFTYLFYSQDDLDGIHAHCSKSTGINDCSHNHDLEKNEKIIRAHAYKTRFLNSNKSVSLSSEKKQAGYRNYFIGNVQENWATHVNLFKQINYTSIYDGIDLNVYSHQMNLKYDIIVKPGSDLSKIRIEYEGTDNMYVENGNLHIETSVNQIVEQKPYVYQIIENQKVEVECNYELKNNILSFVCPAGYNMNYDLIIDPILVAATFSGSSCTNYGHSATYDVLGYIYTGARSFGIGYPTTTGAVQSTFGGSTDIGVSKLNQDGSALVWATYLGGNNSDNVHSMFVNNNFDLYVYGTAASTDYPVSTNAFSTTMSGSTDIVVTKLDSTGTVMIGSTYIGGNDSDGLNGISSNYGDTYRGEIIVNDADNCLVASYTNSSNFPTTASAFQTTTGTQQDGVIFKFNSDLSALIWSTFLGGTGDDACYGIRVDDNDDVYVTGTAANNDFPSISGGAYPHHQGSTRDGFIAKLNSSGSSMFAFTFYGTDQQDQSFFLDLDYNDYVYIYGQSSGSIPVEPVGIYSNSGSHQFIAKFNNSLSSVSFSTVFGSGGSSTDISPSAFMVDQCGRIYTSGHGGSGIPTSPNPLQTSGGFYLLVLEENAAALNYATYYGGSGDHVDGGTSRFDPQGIVYQGVCSGGSMPTVPWAYATSSMSGWDVGVFKIDFETGFAVSDFSAYPDTGCAPLTTIFTNNSTGMEYEWHFNDGSPVDTSFEPTHTFFAGQYDVMLVASGASNCILSDTSYFLIDVTQGPTVNLGPDSILCMDDVLLFDVGFPGATYFWENDYSVITSADPTYTIDKPGTYWVQLNVGNCMDRDTIVIDYYELEPELGPNISDICAGTPVILDPNAGTGLSYLWSNGSTDATISVTQSGTYSVTTTIEYCEDSDEILVEFDYPLNINLGPDIQLCSGDLVTLDAGELGTTYFWSTYITTQTLEVSNPGTYYVTVTNACGSYSDGITITPITVPIIELGPNISICEGTAYILDASYPNSTYFWTTASTFPTIMIDTAGMYEVFVTNVCGTTYDNILISTVNPVIVDLGNDTSICSFDTITIDCFSPFSTYYWSNGETNSSIEVSEPGTYVAMIENACGTYNDFIEIDTIFAEINLGNDTLICDGDEIILDASQEYIQNYIWTTGETSSSISVSSSGVYTLTVTDICMHELEETFELSLFDLNINLGNDTTICEGASIMLNAAYSGLMYIWSNGATSQNIEIDGGGTYSVEVIHNICGTATGQINVGVNPAPIINLGNDTILQNGEYLTLDAGNNFSNYYWSTGESTQSIEVNYTDSFIVSVIDNFGCIGIDTIYVEFTTDISKVENEEIRVFPNPANEYIFISSNNSTLEKVEIYDAIGRQILNKTINSVEANIPILNLPEGLYFVRSYTQNKIYVNIFSKFGS